MEKKTHIYFVPGMAATSAIFEYIKLPADQFEFHFIEWLVPESLHEPLDHYVKRMSKFVEYPDSVLVGVSFGGVIVQEMKKYVNPQKVIIISSIKSRAEMPRRMRFAQLTHVHKMLPTKAFSDLEKYERYAFTNHLKGRIQLYKKYLGMRDNIYLPWALNAIINWEREEADPEVVHIHGTDDFVFPIKYIQNYSKVELGTHVMILIKAKRISVLLRKILSP